MCRFINNFTDTGSRSVKLGSDMRIKLKAICTIVEQLYTGAQRTIVAAIHKKHAPTLIKDTLEKLSMMPAQLEDLKK